MMKSKEEIKKWLLENCINEKGDLDLSELDFSDFDGNIHIGEMTVKKDLYQGFQTVGGKLTQGYQNVEGDLKQGWQKVGGDLEQECQKVEGNFITQTLDADEEYDTENGTTYIVKQTTKLTKEEIEELLGYKIKIVKEK